ncbi:MAG: chromophore lyase CpcT/CpeT [Chitinophagales bacterium]|nr:chromophore lyase CpcT/CpeT [Chitinophagales bacterium]
MLMISMASCGGAKKVFTPDADLSLCANMLVGEFSSESQSKLDSEFLNISMTMVRIWHNRVDGYWIYVEQSLANKMDKPYRQRIYQLVKKGDKVISKIYQFNDPMKYAGAHRDSSKLAQLSIDKLSTKDGCDAILSKIEDRFEGGTTGKNCLSSLKGATYTSSEIVLTSNMIKTWDRGFDGEDKQVWGSEKGPYIFLKKRSSNNQVRTRPINSSN